MKINSNKRQRVKERLSKGQFEEEAKSLASPMGMDQKEAMKLIGNKSRLRSEDRQYYDFTKLKPGVAGLGLL